jgi:MinD-like ATPase involved in chromosome partitioning or flagellar assembly
LARGPYCVRISSQKGGVGKTVFAVNFSIALRELGYKVLLIDADFVNPSVGTYLGLGDYEIGLIEALQKRLDPKRVAVSHTESGVDIVPGTLTIDNPRIDNKDLGIWLGKLKRTDYDFLITDTQPGILLKDVLKFFGEAMIVVTPDNPSCINAIRIAHRYDKAHLKNSVVVNRVRGKGYELSKEEIEESIGSRVIGEIPEDDLVPLSIYEQKAAVDIKRGNRFSKAVGIVAQRYATSVMGTRGSILESGSGGGFWNTLLQALHLR